MDITVIEGKLGQSGEIFVDYTSDGTVGYWSDGRVGVLERLRDLSFASLPLEPSESW
jgi:hypothetical protein